MSDYKIEKVTLTFIDMEVNGKHKCGIMTEVYPPLPNGMTLADVEQPCAVLSADILLALCDQQKQDKKEEEQEKKDDNVIPFKGMRPLK